MAFVQAVSEVNARDVGLIAHVSTFKNLYLTIGVLGVAVVVGLARSYRVNRAARWWGLFSLFAFVVLSAHEQFAYAMMFLLWFGFVAVAFSSISFDNDDFNTFMRAVVSMMALLVVYLYYVSVAHDVSVQWADTTRVRFTSGLKNPSVYARITATLFWMCLLGFCLSRHRWYLVLSIGAAFLLRASDVRADMVGLICGLVMFYTDWKGMRRARVAMISLIAVFSVLLISRALERYEVINDMLSGRPDVWGYVIDVSHHDASVATYLFGTGRSVLFAAVTSKELHYDNTYLEVLLRYGVVGFFLFGAGVVTILRDLNRRVRRSTGDERLVAAWAKGAFVHLLVVANAATVFPSLGSTVNVVLLPMILRVAAHQPLFEKRQYASG
ncbi:MAG: hypothetical protein KC464_06290 [Myxococcales bacterium]|nr:hypothetical protein [Myxococcales bacterium]